MIRLDQSYGILFECRLTAHQLLFPHGWPSLRTLPCGYRILFRGVGIILLCNDLHYRGPWNFDV
jgi:hypothetical protein